MQILCLPPPPDVLRDLAAATSSGLWRWVPTLPLISSVSLGKFIPSLCLSLLI